MERETNDKEQKEMMFLLGVLVGIFLMCLCVVGKDDKN